MQINNYDKKNKSIEKNKDKYLKYVLYKQKKILIKISILIINTYVCM